MSLHYTPKDGDLIVITYKGEDEYHVVFVRHGGAVTTSPVASGKTYMENLLRFAMLGGRLVSEVACSNPVAPRPAPRYIQRVTAWGTPRAKVIKATPLPAELADVWGTATEQHILDAVRERELFKLGMCRNVKEVSVELLSKWVAARMATPYGEVPRIT
jgi:hypothetical protein